MAGSPRILLPSGQATPGSMARIAHVRLDASMNPERTLLLSRASRSFRAHTFMGALLSVSDYRYFIRSGRLGS